jgi:hypothetical protein
VKNDQAVGVLVVLAAPVNKGRLVEVVLGVGVVVTTVLVGVVATGATVTAELLGGDVVGELEGGLGTGGAGVVDPDVSGSAGTELAGMLSREQ